MPLTATDVVDATVHYLVIDSLAGEQIFVFLDHDPGLTSGGPPAEAVTLQLLPGGRLGSPVAIAARPVLGQDPKSVRHFREFRTPADLQRTNYRPVPHYRVCECWNDYVDPWGTRAAAAGSTGDATTVEN